MITYTLLELVCTQWQQLADILVVEDHCEAVPCSLLSFQRICYTPYLNIGGYTKPPDGWHPPIQNTFLRISLSITDCASCRMDGGFAGFCDSAPVFTWNGADMFSPHGTEHLSAWPAAINDCTATHDETASIWCALDSKTHF